MQINSIKKRFKRAFAEKTIIVIASIVLIYLLISLYFTNHFFFHTVINGVNVSLKAHKDADRIIRNYIKDYELQLIERNNEIEVIRGEDIDLQYNDEVDISKLCSIQNSFLWFSFLFKEPKYCTASLYRYSKDKLNRKIAGLNCMNKEIVEPRNVDFKYTNGSYEVIDEVYGNKIVNDKLYTSIHMCIIKGIESLDLNANDCYDNPKYTASSDKTLLSKKLLDRYVSSKIIYNFGNEKEVLDGTKINRWLKVDRNLDIVINNTAVKNFIKELSSKYDTVGITRSFKTSLGKLVDVNGGLYGWKIDQSAEENALIGDIKLGKSIEREPNYAQKALPRGEDELGNTYIEISITRQHLWFYKEGKLIIQGSVVTGNPNRGNATVLGTYMLNYKQKGASLKGPGYEVKVNYWMPFFGNMGIHDAKWRSSFGGEIYKRNGTHGCVNAPLSLAKKLFENVIDGMPVVIYEE